MEHAEHDARGAGESGAAATDLDLSRLSRRERDVLELLGQGLSRAEIARRLYRSPKTIDNHCTRIYDKLGVHSQAQLVRLLHEQGFMGVSGEKKGLNGSVLSVQGGNDVWRALKTIEASIAGASREDYFDAFACGLCQALDLQLAGISEIAPERDQFVIIAACDSGEPMDQIVCPNENSTCAAAMAEGICFCPRGVQEEFPEYENLREYKIEGYIGVRLEDRLLGELGVLWVAHREPIENADLARSVLLSVRQRVATELALQLAVDKLHDIGATPPHCEQPKVVARPARIAIRA